jgi:hypothetical protein
VFSKTAKTLARFSPRWLKTSTKQEQTQEQLFTIRHAGRPADLQWFVDST